MGENRAWRYVRKITGGLLAMVLMICVFAGYANAKEDADVKQYPHLPLYAKSAALIDGDSGRILYAKEAELVLPMASTTKIMTCILALEYEGLDEWVTFSNYAAAQPKVHLGAKVGRQFQLKDLLYSLMLESHNDTAFAIAEHIGDNLLAKEGVFQGAEKADSKQAVERFVQQMNGKAKELGLVNTFFVTPNGLDGSREVQENGQTVLKKHSTTAVELALLMRYCAFESPKKEEFLQITRQRHYSFWDKEGVVCYSCANHNNLLDQMPQALSGKTGFTNAAGYCYVAALTEGEEKYCLALLACGWPNNKSYKWADSKELFTYGEKTYEYKSFSPKVNLSEILVREGADEKGNPYRQTILWPVTENGADVARTYSMLVKENEEVLVRVIQQLSLEAPVQKGTLVGEVEYYLKEGDGTETVLEKILLFTEKDISKKDFWFVLRYVLERFFV